MHVITQKRIWEAKRAFPASASALDGWYRLVKHNDFVNFAELRNCFPSVDKVGPLYVFNIGGNTLRLIANIHFNRGKVFVRHILSHAEYDEGSWKY